MGRLIAIGDVHGCSGILHNLLKGIEPKPDDTFVFLGDLINRGPDAKGVVEEVIDLSTKCKVYTILGNHEEMLLGAHAGGKDDHSYFCKFGGDETLRSYGILNVRDIPREHLLFFANCVDYVEIDDFIFVHAGCDPTKSNLADNRGELLRWTKLDEETVVPHVTGKTVVCGHTVQKKVLDLGHLVAIDTGCGVWNGGRLTALDVRSGTIWQYGGRNKRVTIKKRENGNQTR